MRLSVALICALCACTMASAIRTEAEWKLLHDKQTFVLNMLQHFPQNDIYPEHIAMFVEHFKWDDYVDKFGVDSKNLVEEFRLYIDQGVFASKYFYSSSEKQMKPMRALYRLFYFAEDFKTFVSIAYWARTYVNRGLFGNTFSLAVIQRPDMADVVLPSVYETYPFMFYGANVMDQASKYHLQEYTGDVFEYVVTANYTSEYYSDHKESRLAYYREDVGLNAYYYYSQMDAPIWMNFTEFGTVKPRRGEIYLYQMHNILARYTMERFSNGLGQIPPFSFDEPIASGYNSMLRYYNGIYFPVRNDFQSVYTTENYHYIDAFKLTTLRIQDAIDLGFVELADGSHIDLSQPDAIETLGNIMQANPESVYPRYFKSIEKLAKRLLRGSGDLNNGEVLPGVIERSIGAMRDPMFYQLYNKLMKFYWSFKNHLPSYTDAELFYDNVKFEEVDFTKLTTYFDQFEADITNAVDLQVLAGNKAIATAPLYNFGRHSLYKNHDLHIKSQQMRLNHNEFHLTLKLNAVRPAKVLIKMFLGPKYDEFGNEYSLNEMREHFFEMDEQVVDLRAGLNTIVRNSFEFAGYSQDRTSYYDLYEKLMKKESLVWPLEKGYRGRPSRLMLPKGWKSGMPVQFFFYAMPYEHMEKFDYNGFNFMYNKQQSFGFPLDRQINKYQWKFNPGNMFFYDTVIYHK